MIGTDCQAVRGLTCVGFVLYTLNWVIEVGNWVIFAWVILGFIMEQLILGLGVIGGESVLAGFLIFLFFCLTLGKKRC